MPSYNVTMGQGVTSRNLGNNSLVTGVTSLSNNTSNPGRALQSCTAVAMYNTQTKAAGLFHYPSGNINHTEIAHVGRSREALTAMMQEVKPDRVEFGHGPIAVIGQQISDPAGNRQLSEQALSLDLDNVRLRRFVHTLAPPAQRPQVGFQTVPAGAFLLGFNASTGQFAVDPKPDETSLDVVDLCETREGQYPQYRVHGVTESAQNAYLRSVVEEYNRARAQFEADQPDSNDESISSIEELDLGVRGAGDAPDRPDSPRVLGTGDDRDRSVSPRQIEAIDEAQRRYSPGALLPLLITARDEIRDQFGRVRRRFRRRN